MNEVTIVEKKDFGMLWSLLTIVFAMVIGCGVVVYIEGHTAISYKLESGLQEFEQKFSAAPRRTQNQPVASTVNGALPSHYTMVLQ